MTAMGTHASILILALALQSMLFALGWKLIGTKLGLAPATAGNWALFCLAGGVAMLLFVEPVHAALGGAAVMLRNAALVLSFLLLRRGMLNFLRMPPRRAELWGVFALVLAMMVPLGAAQETQLARTVVLSAALAWYLLRGGFELIRYGAAEFGRLLVGCVGFPLLAFGLAMLGRIPLAVLRPDSGAVSITQASHFNTTLLLGFLVVLPMLQFSLGFLVLVRMVRRLQHLSHHDALTGLLNRRAFDERLRQELAGSRRTGMPLGLLMVDVDHFKRINDRHGHAGGDEALRMVAHRLASAARSNDVVARLGGEEFGVLLPATDAAGIRHAAERLRHAVGGQALSIAGREQAVTVSVGASMRLATHDDAQALLRRADQGLYRAKAEGRDRVVFDTLEGVPAAPPEPSADAPVASPGVREPSATQPP
jgi:diguanylate cyclase (GGDEF)-like protein